MEHRACLMLGILSLPDSPPPPTCSIFKTKVKKFFKYHLACITLAWQRNLCPRVLSSGWDLQTPVLRPPSPVSGFLETQVSRTHGAPCQPGRNHLKSNHSHQAGPCPEYAVSGSPQSHLTPYFFQLYGPTQQATVGFFLLLE